MAFKNLGSVGELFPQSVFIIASYDENGTPNAMNAAWAGECSRKEICFNIGNHKTTANIVKRGAFTVSPADAVIVMLSRRKERPYSTACASISTAQNANAHSTARRAAAS